MANQNLYNQILSGWGSSGVGDDWNGVWTDPGFDLTAPVAPSQPRNISGKITSGDRYDQWLLDMDAYNTANADYLSQLNEYNNYMSQITPWNEAFGGLDWQNMPWDDYTSMGLDAEEVRRLYASGIMQGLTGADIDAAIRTNALQFAPATNLDIPTPNEGTGNLDYSESNSSTYSGLTPELQAQLQGWLDQMDPWVADYGKVLKGLSSPGAFMEAYKPVQDNLIKTKLNELVNKGLMSSSDADTMFKEVLNQAPIAYLQNMGTAADAYSAGMSKLLEGMNMGKYTEGSSSSYSQTPSTNWQMMIDALG